MSAARSTRRFCESGRAGVAQDARQPRRRRPILRSRLARIWRRGAALILGLVGRAASGPRRPRKASARSCNPSRPRRTPPHHPTQIAAATRHQHERVLADDIRAGRGKRRHRPHPLTARWRADSTGQCDESANGSIATSTARRALRSRPGSCRFGGGSACATGPLCAREAKPALGVGETPLRSGEQARSGLTLPAWSSSATSLPWVAAPAAKERPADLPAVLPTL
jgi:hypothetical protein